MITCQHLTLQLLIKPSLENYVIMGLSENPIQNKKMKRFVFHLKVIFGWDIMTFSSKVTYPILLCWSTASQMGSMVEQMLIFSA